MFSDSSTINYAGDCKTYACASVGLFREREVELLLSINLLGKCICSFITMTFSK